MDATRKAEVAKARAADERIAAEWAKYWAADYHKHELALERAEREAHKMARYYATRPEAAARAEARIEAIKAKVAATLAEAEGLRQVAIDLDKELYEGWQRFFLVKHIHATRNCPSFRPTTRIGWLPDVSGLTEAEAVKEYGPNLCTICFPTAPVEWTQGEQKGCPGAGRGIDDRLPHRLGYYSGNWATCPECGKQVGVSRNGLRIPKHDPKEV